jgi:hypothetical protein
MYTIVGDYDETVKGTWYNVIMKLELCSPLVFSEESDVFSLDFTEKDEILLCYDLDSAQSLSIEPDPALLLGPLVFAGRKRGEKGSMETSLPAGQYLFCQRRSAEKEASPLAAEKWLDLAIECQKDALWERCKPGNRLYVRFLFEDECYVTQIFRAL